MHIKKIIAIIATISLLFSLIFVPAYAASKKNPLQVKVTEKVIEEIALNWAEFIVPGKKLLVKDLIPLYNLDENGMSKAKRR